MEINVGNKRVENIYRVVLFSRRYHPAREACKQTPMLLVPTEMPSGSSRATVPPSVLEERVQVRMQFDSGV